MLFVIIGIMFVIYIYVKSTNKDKVEDDNVINKEEIEHQLKLKLMDIQANLIEFFGYKMPMDVIDGMSKEIMKEWMNKGEEARDINVIMNEYLDEYEKKCKNM